MGRWSPPSAKTDALCAAAAQKPTGMVLRMSVNLVPGSFWRSGVWRPQSLMGLKLSTQSTIAYAAQTPSCIVDTVMVMPAVLPPTASSAPLLYSLYFVLPAYLGVCVCLCGQKRRAPTW